MKTKGHQNIFDGSMLAFRKKDSFSEYHVCQKCGCGLSVNFESGVSYTIHA